MQRVTLWTAALQQYIPHTGVTTLRTPVPYVPLCHVLSLFLGPEVALGSRFAITSTTPPSPGALVHRGARQLHHRPGAAPPHGLRRAHDPLGQEAGKSSGICWLVVMRQAGSLSARKMLWKSGWRSVRSQSVGIPSATLWSTIRVCGVNPSETSRPIPRSYL